MNYQRFISNHLLLKTKSSAASIIVSIIIIAFFKVDFYITFHNYKEPINVWYGKIPVTSY